MAGHPTRQCRVTLQRTAKGSADGFFNWIVGGYGDRSTCVLKITCAVDGWSDGQTRIPVIIADHVLCPLLAEVGAGAGKVPNAEAKAGDGSSHRCSRRPGGVDALNGKRGTVPADGDRSGVTAAVEVGTENGIIVSHCRTHRGNCYVLYKRQRAHVAHFPGLGLHL